jgi:hypothetical protein
MAVGDLVHGTGGALAYGTGGALVYSTTVPPLLITFDGYLTAKTRSGEVIYSFYGSGSPYSVPFLSGNTYRADFYITTNELCSIVVTNAFPFVNFDLKFEMVSLWTGGWSETNLRSNWRNSAYTGDYWFVSRTSDGPDNIDAITSVSASF